MSEQQCDVCGDNTATMYCPSCEQPSQCEECCQFLHSKKARKDHKTFTMQEWNSQKKTEIKRTCHLHPEEPVKLFCTDCTALVCLTCITGTHSGHKCTQILEEAENIYGKLITFHQELAHQKSKFETELVEVKETSKIIAQETLESKTKIHTSIEELITLLKKRLDDLYEDVDNSEGPKIKSLEDQEAALDRNINKTIEEMSKIENAQNMKSLDGFSFVSEALERIRDIQALKYEETSGTPCAESGSYKTLLTTQQTNSILAMELLPPIDFWKSLVSGPKQINIGEKHWEHNIKVSLKNFHGNPFKLAKEFSLTATSEPEAISTEVVETGTKGEYNVKVRGDQLGEYKVYVKHKAQDLNGSPFLFTVKPATPFSYESPVAASNIAAFNRATKEYAVLQKNVVKLIELMNPSKSREVKLPIKATHICFSEEGDMYGLDHDKMFLLDRNLKEIWKVSLKEGLNPRGIAYDGISVYVLLQKGPILLYSATTGEYQSLIPAIDIYDAKNLCFYEDYFYVTEDSVCKVYCYEGVLRQNVIFQENTNVVVIGDAIYAAPMFSKTFKKLIIQPEREKRVGDKEALIKDFSEKLGFIEKPKEEPLTHKDLSKGDLSRGDSKIAKDSGAQTGRFNSFFGLGGIGKATPKAGKVSVQEAEQVVKTKVQNSLAGHTGKINHVTATPTGDIIISASNNEIKFWEYASGECIHTLAYGAGFLYMSGIHLFATGLDKTIRIFTFKDRELFREIKVEEEIECLTCSLDLRGLFSGGVNGTLYYHDYQKENGITVMLGKHGDIIHSISVSKDGRTLLTSSGDGTIKLWGMDGKEYKVIKGHTGPVRSVCTTFDSQHIVSCSTDKTIRIWTMDGNKNTRTIKTKERMGVVTVSPNNGYIYAAGENIVRIYKSESGNEKLYIQTKDAPKALVVDILARYIATYDGDKVSIISPAKHPLEAESLKSPRSQPGSARTEKKDEVKKEELKKEEVKEFKDKRLEELKKGEPKQPEKVRGSEDSVKEWLGEDSGEEFIKVEDHKK